MLVTALVIVCGVLLLLGFLLMPGESGMAERAPFWGRNYAHRGLHLPDKSVPENSLAAFTAACEAGYGIELDIQLSADGQVVVFHDDDLKRVCGDARGLGAVDWRELATLRLFDTAQRIPRLREVLDLVDGRVPLIVELKSGRRNRELCERAWQILRTYDGDFCVESFDPRIVGWWRRHVPGILRGQLADSGKNLGGNIGCHLLAGLFANFYARPQFVAFGQGIKPLTARLVERLCMRVCWTVRAEKDAAARQAENDAVIFEFYRPAPRYKPLPGQELEGEEGPDAAHYAEVAGALAAEAQEQAGPAGEGEPGQKGGETPARTAEDGEEAGRPAEEKADAAAAAKRQAGGAKAGKTPRKRGKKAGAAENRRAGKGPGAKQEEGRLREEAAPKEEPAPREDAGRPGEVAEEES